MTQFDGLLTPTTVFRTKKAWIVCLLWGVIFLLGATGFAELSRLPGTVVPEHYQLKMTPDLAHDSFAGEETIDIQVLQPVTAITLNAAEIEFQETGITSAGVTQRGQVTLDAKNETATLSVEKPLAAGPAQIHIVFAGTLNDKLRGFYRANANGRKYAVTQFEGSDARRAFPCFDEPAMKANFSVSLVVDKGDTAISNGAILRDTPGPGDQRHTLVFSTTARMSSYLVAMAVGDFQCVEGFEDGIPFVFAPRPTRRSSAVLPWKLQSISCIASISILRSNTRLESLTSWRPPILRPEQWKTRERFFTASACS